MATIEPGSYVNDIYAPLNVFEAMRTPTQGQGFLPGSYRPKSQLRRLTNYLICDAMRNNTLAQFLRNPDTEHREYGDANRIIQRTVDGIVSPEMGPFAPAAVDRPPASPHIPDPPTELAADATDVDKRIFALQKQRYDEEVEGVVDEWVTAFEDHQRARHVHAKALAWWRNQRVVGKLRESETNNTVTRGDGVLVLGISDGAGSDPTLRVYQPNSYFPDDIASATADYPDRVQFLWEETAEPDSEDSERIVKWHVYDIRPIIEGGDVVFDSAGKPSPVIATDTITDEVVAVDDGWEIRRTLPWHGEGEYTTTTCLLSEYEWADTSKAWADFTEERSTATRFRKDLGYDMMPVIHVPNEEDSGNHFGRSVLLWSAQVLADLGQSDWDNVKAVSLAAHPIVAVSAKNVEGLNYKPGSVWPVDKADSVDMSSQLAAIYEFNSGLRDRLGTTGGVNDVVLGKVNGDIAGITLKLLLGPFEQMIATLRVTRQTKYSLMMKIWQRLAMITGTVDAGPTVPLEIAFGPITPTDLAAVIEQVTKLLTAKSISRSTALRMLVSAGIPIDDVDAELRLIQSTDFEGATNMSAALDDERPAADYLGIELEDPPVVTAPTIEL